MIQEIIKGKVFVLGDNVDTDQIIPAQYLVYSLDEPNERVKYGQLALSGVPDAKSGLPDGYITLVEKGKDKSDYTILVCGKNFGCGSSREHAPAALQIAGIKAVVASDYARIFYRNAVDGGFLIPAESVDSLVNNFKTGDFALLNLKEGFITNDRTSQQSRIKSLGEVAEILQAGNIFEYARQTQTIVINMYGSSGRFI